MNQIKQYFYQRSKEITVSYKPLDPRDSQVAVQPRAKPRNPVCFSLDPREGEPRQPNKAYCCRDYWRLLGPIRAYWEGVAPLPWARMAYMTVGAPNTTYSHPRVYPIFYLLQDGCKPTSVPTLFQDQKLWAVSMDP